MTVLALLADEGFNPLKLSDAGVALWTWIIFLATLPFAWKVVMGPIARGLEERDERAVQAIAKAEKANDAAERARAEIEVRLGEAQAGAARLLAEARGRAEERERELVADAERKAEVLRERARTDIEAAKQQALTAIRDEVVELSLSAAGQVLKRGVSSEDDRRLVRDLVAAKGGAKEARR